jgi:catechol 2,3-dioxygenase-like lactoylglutathione lyase family enzyme
MASFSAGTNIAIKVPLHQYEQTVAFYRDIAKLEVRKAGENTTAFAFGAIALWIDRVPHQSKTDIWLQLVTDELDAAVQDLQNAGLSVRDELEPLNGMRAHWVSDPAGTVLLIEQRSEMDIINDNG